MQTFAFESPSEATSNNLGAAIAAALPKRLTIALTGTLGAGKTLLVRSISGSLGIPPEAVVSPTFVICQRYEGEKTLYHIDAYRLADEDEFLALGPEEFFAAEAITLIEWADRVATCLPPDQLGIEIEVTGETSRAFRFTARGSVAESTLAAIAAAL